MKSESLAVTWITLAQLRRLRGVSIPDVRRFEKTDASFPAVAWVGKRKGLVVLEEYDEWFESRAERAAREREQARRRREFVSGKGELVPRFKRGTEQ